MDDAARRALLDKHMGLVYKLAGNIHAMVPGLVDREELIAWGTTGLCEALARYDASLGASFPTFAYYRVRGSIYDGLRKVTTLPRPVRRAVLCAERTDDYLENLGQRDASARIHTGSPAAPAAARTAHELSGALRSTVTIAALSELHEHDQPRTPAGESADRMLMRNQLRASLLDAVAALPERERYLIDKCYFEGKTMRQAGQELGLSPSWSSRLHARAVDMLRDMLADIGYGSGY